MNLNVKELYNGFFRKINDFLEKEEKGLVSLDLGTAYVKGLYCSGNEIRACMVEKNTGSPLAQASAWLKENNLLSLPVTISLKGQDTLIRSLSFPKVEEKSLKQVFSYEIPKLIPFKKEEVFFDISLLDADYSREEYFLLLAVAKKEFIKPLIDSCAVEQIDLRKITLNNISLINLFLDSQNNPDNSALIDIGSESTLLNIIKEDIPCLSREIRFGSSILAEKMAQSGEISQEEAMNCLVNFCEQKNENLERILQESVSEISEEIKNSFDYFEVNYGQSVEKIYLTGGAAKIKNIAEALSEALAIKIEVWDPLKKFKVSCGQELSPYKEMLAVSAGACL